MSNTKQTQTPLAGLKSAADSIGVHPRTLRRWIADGKLTAYRVGPRMIKINLDDLATLVRPINGATAR